MASERRAGTARFGPFVLDLRSGELQGSRGRQRLGGKAFEALVLLLERAGEVVAREELRERLWASDVFVDFENNLNATVNQLRRALGDSAEAPRYVETVPRRGYRLLVPVTLDAVAAPARRPRLVVLPLDDLGDDDGHGYFATGMTEELTTQLAVVDPERLGVLARTTASHWAATGKGIAALGRDLDVDYVVEGSVRRSAERVRVSVQLIRTRDETHVWARSYDEERRDVLALQADLAHAIAQEIEATVAAPAPARRRVDPDAYDAYLRGQHHAQHYDQPGAWEAAIGCYREAVDRDPQFARGWAALANTRANVAFWGLVPAAATLPAADVEARRAVELDPLEWEAHNALGYVEWFHRWDLDEAERSLRRSVELAPGEPRARWTLFAFLGSMRGAYDEALAEASCALELDPLSSVLHAQIGWIHHWCGRTERAIAHCRGVLGEHPESVQALHILGLASTATGDHRGAIAACRKACETRRDALSLGYLAMALGRGGHRAEAARLAEELETRSRSEYVPPVCLVWARLGTGDTDAAMTGLGRLVEERDPQALWVPFSPTYEPLRGHPRFAGLLGRLPRLPLPPTPPA
jgi:TolB-like protein/Tfp pilus assembly protein PilF